jgi:geranylgeranyl diphosphate synthase, type II
MFKIFHYYMTIQIFSKAIQEEILQAHYGNEPIQLYEPIEYLMSLGGKRLRPLLTLMATSMFTDEWQKAVKPAIAVEVFHNFTLMHDDIMDKAPLRRGKPTVHAKWNENVAILSGDVMLVTAYDLMLHAPATQLPYILKRFNRTAAEVCEGQQYDMNFETCDAVSVDEYLNMIKLKTSVLLGFALELGGLIASANINVCEQLYAIGVNIGMGFQVKDDILDVYGDAQKFGKQVGGDIIANKKTLLLIEALHKATGTTLQQLQHWLLATNFDATEKVTAVTAIYDELGIRQQAEKIMNQYFEQAFILMEQLPIASHHKAILQDFAKQLIERDS